MNKNFLNNIPTSEILFNAIYSGLNLTDTNEIITKRLINYGLSEEEIDNLLLSEILKLKARGGNINSYSFKCNNDFHTLLMRIFEGVKIDIPGLEKDENIYSKLTISEAMVLLEISSTLEKKLNKLTTLMNKNSSNLPHIIKATNIAREYNLIYNQIGPIIEKTYNLEKMKLLKGFRCAITEALLLDINNSKYTKSINSITNGTDYKNKVDFEEQFLRIYRPN